MIKIEEFNRWPSDELFGEKIEVMVMKGKKMISKGTVDLESTNDEIGKKLNIEGKIQEIKRQKKKFIVILKDWYLNRNCINYIHFKIFKIKKVYNKHNSS